MDTMESNYAFVNTALNHSRNDILRRMATDLHIGLCQINGAIKDLTSTVSNVSNSIDRQTEALRKRKYVLVDKFYNVYDEIVKMKYDEEKKCFMMFGKNHSWKIFITSDMDKYNFERLNTKLSYSELYDTVITLDHLINAFGVEYSMDLFNSKINDDALEKLDELLNKPKKLMSEKASKLSDYKEDSCASSRNMNNEIININTEIRELENKTLNYNQGIKCALIISRVYIACVLAVVLGICLNAQVAWTLGLVIGIIFSPIIVGVWIWHYRCKKQGYNSSTIIKQIEQLSEKEKELKVELETFNSAVEQEISNIENEYMERIKKADSEIENFVDSFRK